MKITLNKLLALESSLSDKAIPSDIKNFANTVRWSESKQCAEAWGDMSLHYVIRAMRKEILV